MMIVEQILNNAPKPLLHIADVSGSALFQGDCLDIMPLIPEKSVQLILADLPYGTTACKWDTIIPFDKLWGQYERIIKDNGAIVLFGQEPFSSLLRLSNLELYKYDFVWHKGIASNIGHAPNMPMKKHENIMVFSKAPIGHKSLLGNKRMSYFPQGLQPPKRKITSSESTKKSEHRTHREMTVNGKEYKASNYPISILQYSNASNNERGLHPTQKPILLMEYLIKTYSNENDIVLDNTMGSGTTCLAAKKLNRKFIGIEKEANYYVIACRRCGF